jgi:hypothetical protein
LTFSAEYLADRTKIGQVKAEHVAAVGRISMLPRDTTLVLASTRLRFSSAGSSNGRLKVSEKEGRFKSRDSDADQEGRTFEGLGMICICRS